MPGPVIPGHHHAGPGHLPPIMPGPVIPAGPPHHHNLGPGGLPPHHNLGPGGLPPHHHNLGPGGLPPHHHNLGPGGLPPHHHPHSTPTQYRGLGSKCNFMAGAGNQMG